MTETTSLKDYSIGHIRIKYLDLANMSFAQQNYTMTKGYIDDFLDTIPEDTKAGQKLKQEFDDVTERKKQQLDRLMLETKTLGYLEKKETEERGRTEIEINALHDMKEICWRISLLDGLFHE